MIYADKEFYKNEFLKGRAEIIPLTEFEFWATKATNRINRNKIELEEVPPILSTTTCEVAEALFIDSEKQFASMTPSQTVGGYSKGATPNVQQPQKDFNSVVNEIIVRNLAGTELHNEFVWRGA